MQLILAAGAAPPFFSEVASLLLASAVVAYVCYRFGITPIVSFLITGALIGPHALGLVHDEALIEAAAEVGVVLLLFTIGIEFSLEKLARIQRLIFIGGGLQVGLVIAIVAGLLLMLGVDWRSGVFTGFLVALSSTAILMKLLMSRGEGETTGGQAVLGILIFQDLAVVAMVLMVPMLGGEGGSGLDIGLALGKAVGIIVLVLVVARRVMPRILEAVAQTCSQEIFVLSVMAICFGTAWLTSLAGVSLSLGAFLAGLVVSESRFSELAFGEIQPLQILFSATFFVSVGLLLDFSFLFANLPLVLGIVVLVLLIKVMSAAISVRVLGYGAGTVAFSSLMIAQVGEFSFVLERSGQAVGLFPAGLADGGPQTFIAATVILMMSTPLLAQLGASLNRRFARKVDHQVEEAASMTPEEAPAESHADLEGHVIIAGYGKAGRVLAQVLHEQELPHLIVTLSPDGARHAEAQGLRVLRGNYTRQYELSLAGLNRARLLVVADDDLEMTHRVIRAVQAINPDLSILATTRFESEIEGLREIGARHVVAQERESTLRVVEKVLHDYEISEAAVDGFVKAYRSSTSQEQTVVAAHDEKRLHLTDAQHQNSKCTHTGLTREVLPGEHVCEECLKLDDPWVHLRICMTCGHIGCCDESKNQHATQHFRTTGHPIIKSYEPGETWAWCYADEMML